MFPRLLLLFLLSSARISALPAPDAWVPIRWTGGPLELAWRSRTAGDAGVREAIARWYDTATLTLLNGSPANCLLLTFSAPSGAPAQAEQQQLVRVYAAAAHKRNLAVLGLVYAAGDASKTAADAAEAALDGLVLDGDFTPEFTSALRKAAGSMLVIEIAKDAARWRFQPASIVAVEGVAPGGRNLSEMGIRGAPSSEPWIESNIWLVRSFALDSVSRSVWISSQLRNASAVDYTRAVADAAAAGGRWIVCLDDALRAKLFAQDASALETWRQICSYMKFAEAYVGPRAFGTYGNAGVVLDPAKQDLADEFLKLAARRQVAYRLLTRPMLNASTLATFRALVATELDPLSAAEHKVLQDFAESGGLVIVGPAWGGAAKTEPFVEVPTGKGRIVVYQDPDPESVARDLKELLSDDDLGVVPFNVPSVITSVSGGSGGQPLRVQLLNYFDRPVQAITLRVAAQVRTAQMDTPEGASINLPVKHSEGRTEVTIPKLMLWAVVSMNKEETKQ